MALARAEMLDKLTPVLLTVPRPAQHLAGNVSGKVGGVGRSLVLTSQPPKSAIQVRPERQPTSVGCLQIPTPRPLRGLPKGNRSFLCQPIGYGPCLKIKCMIVSINRPERMSQLEESASYFACAECAK